MTTCSEDSGQVEKIGRFQYVEKMDRVAAVSRQADGWRVVPTAKSHQDRRPESPNLRQGLSLTDQDVGVRQSIRTTAPDEPDPELL